jgi:two-component system, sensor histidine kinase and response regulator
MKTILVIEDEEALLEMLEDLLTAENFEVVGASDGKTGIELARTHLPNLIISDVMMPEADGFDVLRALRASPATATIPFIFLTAKTDRTDWRQGMELGADDYLTKPFTRSQLLKAIAVRLEKQVAIDEQQTQKLEQLRSSIALSLPLELRSPLNSILGYSRLLFDESDSLERSEIQEIAKTIHKSAERLYRLTQNFLLYAELELIAKNPIQIEALQSGRVSSAASAIAQMAILVAKRAGREADLQLDLVDASVRIAKVRLEKIVEELIDNAFKYSPAGTPVRVVGVVECRDLPVNNFYTLSVTDNGRGMTPTQISEVGAYQQFDRKLYEQQGSGLGLTITKRLAQLLGGELAIESTLGQQTMVKVVLPV